ncbi:MAG TPA: hypothetical protein VFQ85_17475 [Mycobacteriales bacterium]|jgi:hypothetical protein|nr:hypothetical protein [Mycobacteriales bacterium]
MNGLLRRVATVGVAGVGMLAPLTANAPAAHAGEVGCASNFFNVPPGATVNCVTDTVGYCVFYYDPVEVFPSGTVGETTTFVFCTAL